MGVIKGNHGNHGPGNFRIVTFDNVSDDEILGGGTGGGGGGIPLDHSSDEDNADAGRVPANTNRRVVPPRSPGTPRKVFTTGHRLTLKKGRRSRHRYDSERQLFACADEFEGFNPDDPNSSWNPEREYRSHFTDLLDNDNLLELFVGESDSTLDNRGNKSSRRSRPQPGTRDPEEQFDAENAYMRINAKLRNAIKKHTPWGMIEGLESDIRSFFEQNPDSGSKYVLSGLTSYERLLAHACSNYNLLNSNSLDGQDGNRTLTIANPSPKFTKPEPSLTDYLKTRLEIAA